MAAYCCGELESWPTKEGMAEILRNAGLTVRVGRYSIRLVECPDIVFEAYGGDLCDPQIEADAETTDDVLRECSIVSRALAAAGIRHRFEIYDEDSDDPNEIVEYLHHEWPLLQA